MAKLVKSMKRSNLFSKPIFHSLLIITICSIVYSNTLESPFVFDDKLVIVENPIVRDLGYMVNPSEAKVYRGISNTNLLGKDTSVI